jgi:hypothetical protein
VITERWAYLTRGAQLAGALTETARGASLTATASALEAMTREELEAAAFAMAVILAQTPDAAWGATDRP